MWITPSGIPRYNLQEKDLVKVHLETDRIMLDRRWSAIKRAQRDLAKTQLEYEKFKKWKTRTAKAK